MLGDCQIVDREGSVEEFVAHAVDEVTGPLKNLLMARQLKLMFHTFQRSNRLTGTRRVDYILVM